MASFCTIERLWTCTTLSELSVCRLINPPAFSGVQIFANTTYTKSTCLFRVTVSANFYFKSATTVTIGGLKLSTNQTTVDIVSTDLSPKASWDITSGFLTVNVTNPDTNFLFFTLVGSSPLVPQTAVQVEASCFQCIADLPNTSVPTFSAQWPLSFTDLPKPSCVLPRFGPNCEFTCQGLVVVDKCVCLTGQFGFTCNQTAVKLADSPPPKQVVPDAPATITSSSGIGVRIPAGALTSGITISVDVYEVKNLDVGVQKDTITPAGPVVVFEPSGIRFEKPVEIFTPFDPTRIPPGKSAFVFYNNESAFPPWQRQESEVVPGKNLTRALVYHFSGYMSMAADPPVIPSLSSNASVVVTVSSTPASSTTTPKPYAAPLGLILGLIGGGVGVMVTMSASLVVYRYSKKARQAEDIVEEFSPVMADTGLASASLVLHDNPEGLPDSMTRELNGERGQQQQQQDEQQQQQQDEQQQQQDEEHEHEHEHEQQTHLDEEAEEPIFQEIEQESTVSPRLIEAQGSVLGRFWPAQISLEGGSVSASIVMQGSELPSAQSPSTPSYYQRETVTSDDESEIAELKTEDFPSFRFPRHPPASGAVFVSSFLYSSQDLAPIDAEPDEFHEAYPASPGTSMTSKTIIL
ncbi:hypothetical protein GUITHDRAFT_111653 [Guillardia theta CCMP2712]|uniref:ZU5 domain-containing protein n=1 Tax=Guillardia theta (strain CCMP2712) TaxID=905079 RepID=L1J2Q6_GUITC|nr:hypothetical protein GUITHDRAFT_111653 [Guillardia theta CCMP2712]EKX42375.1 hypothetical protein GUITHDRAFT_111653 [Guillardia theta CCMP2712]|eukprot:XP_005829355.1 hypothetical protein GUITHDRAFT_111653 [Guillardia theta CCMP2712]